MGCTWVGHLPRSRLLHCVKLGQAFNGKWRIVASHFHHLGGNAWGM